MEELEHEADLFAAEPGQRILVERRDVHAVDADLTRRRGVEASDEPEQCGLAAARRADDGEALPVRHVEGERVQDGERRAAALNGLADAAQRDHEGRLAAWSAGSSTFQTVSATRRAPSGFGWMPSAWLSAGSPATPSSRNGMRRHLVGAGQVRVDLPEPGGVVRTVVGRGFHAGQNHDETGALPAFDDGRQVLLQFLGLEAA